MRGLCLRCWGGASFAIWVQEFEGVPGFERSGKFGKKLLGCTVQALVFSVVDLWEGRDVTGHSFGVEPT